MTLFWLIAGALAALTLLVVLVPRSRRGAVSRRNVNVSIYRDQLRELDGDLASGTLAQADYDRARRELEARLLQDVAGSGEPAVTRRSRALVAGLAAALPLLALALYFLVGNPAAVDREAEALATHRQLESMVDRLAARLRESPEDVDAWKLLGRSYSVLGRFSDAADAYAKAAARAPRDAQLLADFADTLGMARGQTLQGEPEKLVLRALEIDPDNLKALALAGTAAFERKDFARAAAYWERMLPLVPADSEDARSVRANVAEARALAGQEKTRPLQGVVRLAPNLKARASPDDTVFVFARAAEGPAMPLAVKRARVRDLPLEFSLDDSMAMAPGMTLSAHPRVVVTARVSRSGRPTPEPGDLQGASKPVANDAGGVSVLIDSVVR